MRAQARRCIKPVLGFCSKDRAFVAADPGYEAGGRAAKFIGAKNVLVPLRKGTWDHDVRAMLAAEPNAGLYYICNPNNPTGTLTSRADIEWLVAKQTSRAPSCSWMKLISTFRRTP